MKILTRVQRCAVLACAVFALSGCGGTSPPVRFFTLASEPPPTTASRSGATDAGYAITVGPVTVPELVDRPQLVLRSSSTQVEVAEQARWAAPLKTEIPRVIADQLARLLPDANTATSAQRAVSAPDYRVLIDIQRFDSTPRENATVEASWTVRAVDGASISGRSIASEPGGGGYDELVAAHSRALNAVSRDIAAAIAQLRSARQSISGKP
jgi:uncharacterized lipoprotein YmbA